MHQDAVAGRALSATLIVQNRFLWKLFFQVDDVSTPGIYNKGLRY